MQGPQTDAELLTEALGDFAEVTPQDRWSGVLDRRWLLAISIAQREARRFS